MFNLKAMQDATRNEKPFAGEGTILPLVTEQGLDASFLGVRTPAGFYGLVPERRYARGIRSRLTMDGLPCRINSDGKVLQKQRGEEVIVGVLADWKQRRFSHNTISDLDGDGEVVAESFDPITIVSGGGDEDTDDSDLSIDDFYLNPNGRNVRDAFVEAYGNVEDVLALGTFLAGAYPEDFSFDPEHEETPLQATSMRGIRFIKDTMAAVEQNYDTPSIEEQAAADEHQATPEGAPSQGADQAQSDSTDVAGSDPHAM